MSAAAELRAAAAATPTTAGDTPVAVEELRDRAALAALRDEWERVAAAMADAGWTRGPFLAPDWFAIWAASLGGVELLVAHRGGRLVAALPLLPERRRLAGFPARILRSLTDDHSQRFDLLLDPADAEAGARALVAHLQRRRGWDAVELQSVPQNCAAAQFFVDAAIAAGFSVGDWPSMVSPYLTLPPTVAALDKQLGSKFRGNLRRRAKKLAAEVGPLSLERVDGRDLARTDGASVAAALDALLDEGFALEAAGWKGAAGTAIACSPSLRARYRAVAHAWAARGELACYFLRAGDRRVAFHFALVGGGVYYLFKPGFDPALASYGPGHLLVDLVARDLIARGIGELDFLGDDMPWKREWTDTARAHSFRYLFAPTLRGRALALWKLQLVPFVKRLTRR